MKLFRRSTEPSTGVDELASRYAILAADVEILRGKIGALQTEWDTTLTLLRKERARVEEAERRRNRKETEENEALESTLPADPRTRGVEAHGFGAKLRRIQTGG